MCDARPADGMHCDLPSEAALQRISEHPNMKPKNTICLWFDKDAQDAARF